MIDGLTTARAHLDPLEALSPIGGEIDYTELVTWLRTTDPNRQPPAFAGRYFLGHVTRAEVDAGVGFCLWAHGEGAVAVVPRKIVPIQRADDDRQSRYGEVGIRYGREDASALARHLDLCLKVGDLEMGDAKQILVFLEIADGTELSFDYWASWATTLYDSILTPARLKERSTTAPIQPLLPAVLCAFTLDESTQKFLPDALVRRGLDFPPSRGLRNDCQGFWARRKRDDPGLLTHSFGWTNIGEPSQARVIPGFGFPYMARVPVRYLRWFDGPEGLSIPEGPLRDTLSLLTLDWPTQEPSDDPLIATLTATTWSADAVDPITGTVSTVPTQFGVDKNRDMSPYAACLKQTSINVHMVPAAYSWKDDDGDRHPATFRGTFVEPPVSGLCSLVFRYYSGSATSLKNLKFEETMALSAAGFEIGVTWEGNAPTKQGDSVYINALIRPFKFFEGREDGRRAFEIAANKIHQPPYTPVYFAVDFPPGDPDYYEEQMPDYDVIVRYFQDVHRGYRDYLETHPDAPYYVGVYAQLDVCAMLYRGGLVTHFWQPWPPTWGNNWRAFRHANAWQIILANTLPHPSYPDMLALNPDLGACVPGSDGDDFGVDINIAWGDPGTFQVFS